jgi:hypothetical protein
MCCVPEHSPTKTGDVVKLNVFFLMTMVLLVAAGAVTAVLPGSAAAKGQKLNQLGQLYQSKQHQRTKHRKSQFRYQKVLRLPDKRSAPDDNLRIDTGRDRLLIKLN